MSAIYPVILSSIPLTVNDAVQEKKYTSRNDCVIVLRICSDKTQNVLRKNRMRKKL
jgi:hypothetical protein